MNFASKVKTKQKKMKNANENEKLEGTFDEFIWQVKCLFVK